MTQSNSPLSADPISQSFAYTAQGFDGQPMNGTIEAADLESATKQLRSLQLRIVQISPVTAQRPRALSGADFAAFNQQLANLSAAGLPIEHGLRLIAEDLRHGGLAQSVRDVASELERGTPLGEAFHKHQRQFPPLYGAIVDAGVRAGNLPHVLLNVGRHLELVARLRATLWKSAAYPLMVLAGLFVVLVFIGQVVLPKFTEMYHGLLVELPGITLLVFGAARFAPALLVLGLAVFLGSPVLALALRVMNLDRSAKDLLIPLPIIGPVLRRNLIARWCDAMKLGIQANMDLPAAVEMAGRVVGSPSVQRDAARIIARIASGEPLDRNVGKLWVIPPPVLSVIQFAAERNDLPASLETLSRMYEQQAEMRLSSLQTVLMPLLLMCVALMVAITIIGLFAPIISLFQAVT